jgi:hypothetical protein
MDEEGRQRKNPGWTLINETLGISGVLSLFCSAAEGMLSGGLVLPGH